MAVSVAAAAAMLVGATTAMADDPSSSTRPERAFAMAGAGAIPFGPLPMGIASPDGQPVSGSVLSAPPGLPVQGGLLTAEARAGFASATAANLDITGVLSARLITVTCDNGRGSFSIGGLSVAGTALPTPPTQPIDLGILRITFGEETRNADGSLTITGVKIFVLPAMPGIAGAPGVPGFPALPKGLPGLPIGSVPTKTAAIQNISHVTVEEPGGEEESSGETTPTTVTAPPNTAPAADTAAPKALPEIPGIPGLPGVPAGAAQTITIGSATCAPFHPDNPGNHRGDDWGDDHDGNDHDRNGKDHEDGRDHEPSADHADEADSPDVVEASLPVTG